MLNVYIFIYYQTKYGTLFNLLTLFYFRDGLRTVQSTNYMRFHEILEKVANEFTQHWNQWDINKLCSMMTEQVRLYSPMVKKVYPENEEMMIQGREEVRRYWIKLRNITGGYEVNQISIQKEDKVITTVNKIIGSDVVILETLTLNQYAKIETMKYEYIIE
jgi:hypothetical protein